MATSKPKVAVAVVSESVPVDRTAIPPLRLRERFTTFGSRTLRPGDLIRLFDNQLAFVQYVNTSGAYIVPLDGVNREIKGHAVTFNAGGRTISANSAVEHVTPLSLGGNSPEYRRYVRMLVALREGMGGGGIGAAGKGATGGTMAGTTLGEFDTSDQPDPVPAEVQDEANAVLASNPEMTSATSGTKGKRAQMAKSNGKAKAAKANGHANGKAREKAPKTVRNCVCGCGTETTGHFAPGHDARFHGWIKKLADGRIQRNGKDAKSGEQVVGASVLNKLGLVAKGEGFKASTPDYYLEA